MNKEEFIEFLKTKQEEASGLNPSWCKIATNSDDYWKLNKQRLIGWKMIWIYLKMELLK